MKKYPGSWLAKPLSGCESPAAGRAGMSPGAPSPEPPSPEPPSPESPSPERPSPVWVTVVVSPAPADPPEPVSTVVGSAVTVVVVGVGLGCDSVEQAEAPSSATAAVMRSRARERGMRVMSGLSPKGAGSGVHLHIVDTGGPGYRRAHGVGRLNESAVVPARCQVVPVR